MILWRLTVVAIAAIVLVSACVVVNLRFPTLAEAVPTSVQVCRP